MSDHRTPWEPDPNRVGHRWTDMFNPTPARGGERGAPDPAPAPPPVEDGAGDAPDVDSAAYRPWLVQRGRPAMMLALRWYDAKAGLWHASAMAYPNLHAIDSIGGRIVSFDFGTRQFVLEGRGLDELVRHMLEGSVRAIVRYDPAVWPVPPQGPVVTAIRRVTQDGIG